MQHFFPLNRLAESYFTVIIAVLSCLFSAAHSCLLLSLNAPPPQALRLYNILLIKKQLSAVMLVFVLLHMSLAVSFAQLLQVKSNLD